MEKESVFLTNRPSRWHSILFQYVVGLGWKQLFTYVQYKWPIGKPRVDYLRDSIWEVRSKIGNRIARVLFAVEQSEMILLHAFIKKT